MNTSTHLDQIRAALTNPSAYPHPVRAVMVRETHISLVFLTGEWVYKIKKPVNLGFLDFRDLDARRRFCEQEVRLNRRLSSGVYQDVVEIYAHTGGLALVPDGEPVEYAVRMRQLPEEANLAELARRNAVTPEQIRALADTLARFHADAESGPRIASFGEAEVIQHNMEENFAQIRPFAETFPTPEHFEFTRQVSRAFWDNHAELFARRVRQGKIRDGHGDLRAEHVYFHHGVHVIDCIEFNQRFRYGDTALDLAFLVMDLERLHRPELADAILAAYARAADDAEIHALIDFYAAYRAFVRLKVGCLTMEQQGLDWHSPFGREVLRFLHLASVYALVFSRPTLWVFSGLPASGKSTLAGKTATAFLLPHVQSDLVRKDVLAEADTGVCDFGQGAYQPLPRNRVYAEILNLAQEELRKGRSVVMDATFSRTAWREAALRLAKDHNAVIVFVHCVCPSETILARLERREQPGQEPEASAARARHFPEIRKHFEPWTQTLREYCLDVDTNQPIDAAFHTLLDRSRALRRKQATAFEAASP